MTNRKKGYGAWLPAWFLFTALVSLLPLAHAQEPVPVTLSDQKIITEGRVYYLHVVKRGQTLYSIARAYSVSVDLLTRENRIEDNAIREGQALRIPEAAVLQGRESISRAVVRTGVDSLAAVALPVTDSMAVAVRPPADKLEVESDSFRETPQQDEQFIYHLVLKGESLGSIAGIYEISVRDLKRANRGLLFPREGRYILIPRNKVPALISEQWNRPDEAILVADSLAADNNMFAGEPEHFTVAGERAVIERLNGSVRVAVLLPFYLRENGRAAMGDSLMKESGGNASQRELSQPLPIYSGALPFLELYEGILIAADSLRALGLNVTLEVFDTGADSTEIYRLLWSEALNGVDLIIGPVFSSNLGRIATWAAERNIPVVSPVPLRDRNIVENKPSLYRVYPSERIIRDAMMAELTSHTASRIIFVHADSAMIDPSTMSLWEEVSKATEKSLKGNGDSAVSFYFSRVHSARGAGNHSATLESLLDADRENLIILASSDAPVVSSVFSTLHGLAKWYNIKVIGYPELRDLETIDLRYYYDLQLCLPTESFIDYKLSEVQAFLSLFRKRFKTEPMAASFAWRGFDIAWYFIGGIATGGTHFLADPGLFNPTLLSIDPFFSRDSRLNGYENRGIYMLHYRKGMTIDVARPWQDSKMAEPDSISHSLPYSSIHSQVR